MSMQVQTEDITVPWGQAPDSLDQQYGKWRLAVFQDLQESIDTHKLYFLYDPVADDTCLTTGTRKGMTSLIVFDTYKKCFVAEIPLRVQGRVKFLFALNSPSPAGGTAFVLVTQSEDYGQFNLHTWRINLNVDGLSLQNDPYSLMTTPLVIDSDFICSMREDKPELVIVYGPDMNIVRIDASSPTPKEPVDRFSVPGAKLSHFYDGFVSIGNIYFLSASPDGMLDWSRVHVLNLESRGQISTYLCQPDPQRGMPPGRKQAALDAIAGFILMAGGEIDYGGGNVSRLVDYWVLDIAAFKWHQVPAQMPVPLIEPRLTTSNSGNVYLWGDFDEPLPGMPPQGTHVRIMLIRGFNYLTPPPYQQATQGYPGSGGNQPYPAQGGPPGYPSQGGPGYPSGGGYGGAQYPGGGGGGAPGYPGGQQQYGSGPYPAGQYQGDPPGQGPYPVYPPKHKDEKCSLS